MKNQLMYQILRSLLFLLPPEHAHHFALKSLNLLYRLKFLHYFYDSLPSQPCEVAGLQFKNRIGLAAGLDNNAEYLSALAALGPGFIEVGGVTPRPQSGNPKPRLFRLLSAQALINRKGFCNQGVDKLVDRLKIRPQNCVVGVNLGKNKETPLNQAVDDYLISLEKIFPYADFATINISSPNTPGLRDLQKSEYLLELLTTVRACRDRLQKNTPKIFPLFVKLSPDISAEDIARIMQCINESNIEGIIATNSTAQRQTVKGLKYANEEGGLSGRPLQAQSRWVLSELQKHNIKKLPIISLGGIDSVEEASERFSRGASLIQIYTAFIYRGPGWLRQLIKHCSFKSY